MRTTKATERDQTNPHSVLNNSQPSESLGSSPLSSARSSLELNPWDLLAITSQGQSTPSRSSEEFVSAPEEQPQVFGSREAKSTSPSDTRLEHNFRSSNSTTSRDHLASNTTLSSSVSSEYTMSFPSNAYPSSQRQKTGTISRSPASQSQFPAINPQSPHAITPARSNQAARKATTKASGASQRNTNPQLRLSPSGMIRASAQPDNDHNPPTSSAVPSAKKRKANDGESYEATQPVATASSAPRTRSQADYASTHSEKESDVSYVGAITPGAPCSTTQPFSSRRFSEAFLTQLDANEQRIRARLTSLNNEVDSNRKRQDELAEEIQRLKQEEKQRLEEVEKAKKDLGEFDELQKHAERLASLGQ